GCGRPATRRAGDDRPKSDPSGPPTAAEPVECHGRGPGLLGAAERFSGEGFVVLAEGTVGHQPEALFAPVPRESGPASALEGETEQPHQDGPLRATPVAACVEARFRGG